MRPLIAVLTVLAIAAVSFGMTPAGSAGAVMRVSLDKVPEERVVEFGHEMPRMALALPVADTVASPEQSLPSSGDLVVSSNRPERAPIARNQPKLARTVEPDADGILPIDFQLQEGVSSQKGGVGVAKTLAAEGGQATGLTIFLIGGSLIEVDRSELIAALAQLGASAKAESLPAAGDTGRLSLDHVRTAGFDLRYDAIQDRLVLRP